MHVDEPGAARDELFGARGTGSQIDILGRCVPRRVCSRSGDDVARVEVERHLKNRQQQHHQQRGHHDELDDRRAGLVAQPCTHDQLLPLTESITPDNASLSCGSKMPRIATTRIAVITVTMTHVSKDGESKLLERCSLPLTGAGCIRKVLTDLAYLEIEDGAFILRETAPGVSIAEIAEKTAGRLIVPDDVKEMTF